MLSYFTSFDVDAHDRIALMNLNLCLAIALPKSGLMNSIVAVAHCKTNSEKDLQKQQLCLRVLMPSVN